MAKTKTRRVYVTRSKARRRKKSMTLPLGIVAPVLAVGVNAWQDGRQWGGYNYGRMLDYVLYGMTGYSYQANNWKAWRMQYGLLPIGIGYVVHKVATRFGINRALGSSGIPFIRI